jgi:hypothetical protein
MPGDIVIMDNLGLIKSTASSAQSKPPAPS